MAHNGFIRRSNTSSTRTYPGTASRLGGTAFSSSSVHGNSTNSQNVGNNNTGISSTGSEQTVFVRPLSRSQLAPVHAGVGSRRSPFSNTGQSSGRALMDNHRYTPPTPPARPISIDQPRPTSERHRNLYLGAPVLPQNHQNVSPVDVSSLGQTNSLNTNSHVHSGASQHSKNHRIFDSSLTAAEQVRLPTNSKQKFVNNNNTNSRTSKNRNINRSDRSSQGGGDDDDEGGLGVVTSQPTKRSLLGEEHNLELDGGNSGNGLGKSNIATETSIVCPYCRKCRCEACATPRPLPSHWICSKSIQCGPESLLDYATCLCCVKALFYHCGKNHEPDGGVMCADKPCSCAPHRKFWRWGCMTAMSLVLPCLCLYWPCKGCIHVAEKAYQRYHSNGCTCRSPPTSSNTQNRPNSAIPSQPHLLSQTEDPRNCEQPQFDYSSDTNSRIGATKLLPSVESFNSL